MNSEELLGRLTALQAELASLIDELSKSSSAGPLTSGVAESARLVALNMALSGAPREEADRYLAENFELENRRGLLDEVYASVAD